MTLVQWLRSAASDASRVRWHLAFGIAWALLAFAQSFLMSVGGLFVGAYAVLAIAHLALVLRYRRSDQESVGFRRAVATDTAPSGYRRIVIARASRAWSTP